MLRTELSLFTVPIRTVGISEGGIGGIAKREMEKASPFGKRKHLGRVNDITKPNRIQVQKTTSSARTQQVQETPSHVTQYDIQFAASRDRPAGT